MMPSRAFWWLFVLSMVAGASSITLVHFLNGDSGDERAEFKGVESDERREDFIGLQNQLESLNNAVAGNDT